MPVKIGRKTFDNFDEAVNYVRRTKKIPIEKARAYVATIERKEKKKK